MRKAKKVRKEEMGFCKESLFPVLNVDFSLGSRRRQSMFLSSRIIACRSHPPYKVFINHRGSDTKRNIAALIHDRLDNLKLQSFLDYKSMKLGEELEESIDTAIRECTIGVTIFSPNYCTSDSCLRELVLMMECEKVIIPIFFDVEASDLVIVDDGRFPEEKLQRFRWALKLAKNRVGISFDSCKGDWSILLKGVAERVIEILMELEVKEKIRSVDGDKPLPQVVVD
ncbi:TIR-only protein-like [Macadamia integrifolia]|uniref:TIR-only protein-like n=1 Tax=Macadamia integrifolia TaxID=60698 RepID=UPI001C4E77B6|nr:TIR-only protein-like [Macadamia integrifolia]